MAQSIAFIYDRLSRIIFKKPFQGLTNMSQKCFIIRHYRWFTYYRGKIAEQARKAITKKLNGKDYEIIFDWYTAQIPAYCVINAIQECSCYAEKHSKSIYSLNYFRQAVIRHFETHRKQTAFSGEVIEDDDRWHYKSYMAWTKHEINRRYYRRFHPFYGPNPDHGVTR